MKIHILGICGSFMGGIAVLAKQLGHDVSGCDANVYPPMSSQLEEQGIELLQGFSQEQFETDYDLIIIGNAMTRGNPAVEYVLDHNLPYMSGPEWLAQNILQNRHVLALSGTHGKTSTSSMLAWVLEYAGLNPGFMIGGVPENFGVSARLGLDPYFVIEADEYDSGFFDKRSKFVHYHARTLVINNLEYDHADIFPDLAAIQIQFHHLIRTVPGNGLIIWPQADDNIRQVIDKGCWTQQEFISEQGWHAKLLKADGSEFVVYDGVECKGKITWQLVGQHNVSNALAVIAVASNLNIEFSCISEALSRFKNAKRRLEVKGIVQDITIYDDFAHHPTAIELTLEGLRNKVGDERIIAVVELGSYTMRSGEHQKKLLPAIKAADEVIFYKPEDDDWELKGESKTPWQVESNADRVLQALLEKTKPHDHILIMSNRAFSGIHDKLLTALQEKYLSKAI